MSVEDRFREAYSEEQLELFEEMRPNKNYHWGAKQRLLVVIVLTLIAIGYFGA